MSQIKIHIFHTGKVCVSPNLPFCGNATRSWRDMITSDIAADKGQQLQSHQWIREQSSDKICVETLTNHDADVEPHIITP